MSLPHLGAPQRGGRGEVVHWPRRSCWGSGGGTVQGDDGAKMEMPPAHWLAGDKVFMRT
jgi:hypothetical protein